VVYRWDAKFPAGVETVLYPTRGGVVAEIEVTRTRSEPDTGAVLVTVTTRQSQDQFVIARSPGRHEFPESDIAFEGTMAMVRSAEGEVAAIGLLGTTYLRLPAATIVSPEPADGSIAIAEGQWVVGDGVGAITVARRDPG
jgi:hypothetical protein